MPFSVYSVQAEVAASGDIFLTDRDTSLIDLSYSTTNIKGTVDP